jgi:hypothetical protein
MRVSVRNRREFNHRRNNVFAMRRAHRFCKGSVEALQRQRPIPHRFTGGKMNPRPMSENELGQLKANLVLVQAKTEMIEKELETFKARLEKERQLFGWIANNLINPGVNREPLRAWQIAHAEHSQAQIDIKIVQVEEMKRDRNVLHRLIEEAEKGRDLIVPGRIA